MIFTKSSKYFIRSLFVNNLGFIGLIHQSAQLFKLKRFLKQCVSYNDLKMRGNFFGALGK